MTFLPQEIIRRKRDGGVLGADEIRQFVEGMTSGAVRNEQVSALAMAIFFRGMTVEERVALTLSMRDSGTVMTWQGFDGPIVDKHSTGGIGDTVSLVLAPALAASGCFVPMISGRGLGHTGGTLDKLEAIPGYRTDPDEALFRETVRQAGCAVIGQTDDLAPADRIFYAIRDVTGTVESLDLITASILSKKLAAGLDGLVLDVKCGSGAFMASEAEARALAGSLVEVANGAGTRTTALMTDMNEPLAAAAGNALEVRVAIDVLKGGGTDGRLHAASVALGGELLALCGLAADVREGERRIAASIADGRAAERFARMVAALGGPADLMEAPDRHLAAAPVRLDVTPAQAGTVTGIDTRAIGLAVIELGGGRRAVTDRVDPAVGFTWLAGLGESVGDGRPLGAVHAKSQADAERAAERLRALYAVEAGAGVERGPLVIGRVAGET